MNKYALYYSVTDTRTGKTSFDFHKFEKKNDKKAKTYAEDFIITLGKNDLFAKFQKVYVLKIISVIERDLSVYQ